MLEDINITNNTFNKPRAVVIARVSSREQENGQSIDAQLENLRRYCSREHINIVKEFKIPEIYESSNFDEKRKVLKLLYSNFLLEGKNPLFSIRKPLENILSGGFRHVWSGRRDWLDFL